jgi:hypothetical protein
VPRRIFRIAIFFAVAAAAAAGAFAQALPGSVEIGGGGGRFYGGSFAKGSNREFAHRVEADDDILHGFWLGAQLSKTLALEVAVRKSKEDLVHPDGGVFPNEPTVAGLELTTVDLGVLRLFPIGRFFPYVAAGAGVSNLNINVPDKSVRDVNRLGISAAVGAKFYAARWVGFRVEGRARATYLGRRGTHDGGWSDGGRWFRNQELLGGVFFSFGGRS